MPKSASVVDLKKSQIAFIEDFMAYPNGRGYVLDLNRPGFTGDSKS